MNLTKMLISITLKNALANESEIKYFSAPDKSILLHFFLFIQTKTH